MLESLEGEIERRGGGERKRERGERRKAREGKVCNNTNCEAVELHKQPCTYTVGLHGGVLGLCQEEGDIERLQGGDHAFAGCTVR